MPSRPTASTSTARSTRGSSSRPPLPISSCTSSRAPCSRRWTCRSASSSAPLESSGTRSRGADRQRTPVRHRWTSAATRSPEQLLDQRHLDADSLAELLRLAKEASERFAREEDLEVEWERIWSIEPILFDEELVELADESINEVAGTSHRLPSGPLHDAAEVARAGIPTVMLFVQSLRGLSHTKLEDTKEEHLELSVQALDRLADRTIAWVSA